VGASSEILRGWERWRWWNERGECARVLQVVAGRHEGDESDTLRSLANLLQHANEHEAPSESLFIEWRDQLHALAAQQLKFGDAKCRAPNLRSLRRFWIAAEYRLRVQSGENWKHARGAVSTAWGVTDSTCSDYASREMDAVTRLITTVLAERVQCGVIELAALIKDISSCAPSQRGESSPRRKRRTA
jgi:hypothetical protein